MSPYGASKLAAESYVMAYRAVYGLEALALRFFNVYGPLQRHDHDYAAVIPKFAWAALHGKPLEIHGDGEQTRDFTHINSVIDVLTQAVNGKVVSERPVNLAFGDRMTVNGIAEVLEGILGESLPRVHSPARVGDVRNSLNDPSMLRELFPTVASVPFEEGITSVVEWMQQTP
jgi:UDP-glucose 4-epimerase